MRHPSEYTLTLLPPSPHTDGMWYGYARDGQHSPGGSDDVTPDNVKAHGYTPDGVACELYLLLLDYLDTINKEAQISATS